MGRCEKCSIDYPLLNTETCFVCRSIEGKSDVEKGNIKKKAKCTSCSLIYSELERPLCQTCVFHWVDQNIVPASLTRLPGVIEQIQQVRNNTQLPPPNPQASATANGVLSLAHEYRQNSSQPRHQVTPNISRPQNSSLRKATLAGAANRTLTKTQAVITAANQKRQGAIHLFASLWIARKGKAGQKLENLDRYSIDKMFNEKDTVINAFESSLVLIRNVYEKTNPGRAGFITTRNITFHAHISKTNQVHLDIGELGQKTMDELFQFFADHTYINASQITARKLIIRLVIQEKYLPDDEDEQYEGSEGCSALPPSSSSAASASNAQTAAHRVSAVSSRTSKRKPVDDLGNMQSEQQPFIVRTSAFRPRVPYSRDVILRTWRFQKVNYDPKTREFCVDGTFNEIMLSQKWQDDLSRKEGRARDSAYIGSGFSKNVFYARYNGKEYAFAQSKEGYSEEENSRVLRAEFENLADGHIFSNEFKDNLRTSGLVFPNFRFNFTDAFIGILQMTNIGFDNLSDVAHYTEFIATPLLPCGEANDPIQKYTGNENVGQPPNDRMTSLMHAFMHYTYVMSGKTLLFCDLQGILDINNILCLIDPQVHSDMEDVNDRLYWDGGPKKLKSYINHHINDAGCKSNQFCCGLKLLNTKVEHAN